MESVCLGINGTIKLFNYVEGYNIRILWKFIRLVVGVYRLGRFTVGVLKSVHRRESGRRNSCSLSENLRRTSR